MWWFGMDLKYLKVEFCNYFYARYYG